MSKSLLYRASILEILRDSTFSNKDSRAEFASLIVQLALSTDPRARKAIKKLGNYFTELGHELLGTNQKIEPISAPSSKDRALYKETVITPEYFVSRRGSFFIERLVNECNNMVEEYK